MNRQYSPEEVSAILKEAAEETRNRPDASRAEGLTLAELQAIGAESDIDAVAIQQAAVRLDARTLEPVKKRMLGINVGASHAVRLPRPMTESEFAAVVSDCRRIFDARGKVSEQTNYREWRNGNLRIWTEQDPHSGESRLSMQSTQSQMRAMIGGGGLLFLWAAVMVVTSIFESGGDALAMGATLAIAAMLLVATGGLTARSWSSTREEQMDEIGRRALERQAQDHAEALTDVRTVSHAEADTDPVPASEKSDVRGGMNTLLQQEEFDEEPSDSPAPDQAASNHAKRIR